MEAKQVITNLIANVAKVTDVFISGTLGNIVFYRRMGKSCMRLKRDYINQSAATKKRNIAFGIAASAATVLREELWPLLPAPTNRSMQSRFSGSIAKWLGVSAIKTIPPANVVAYVTGFQFGIETFFTDICKITITVDTGVQDRVTVQMASFNPTETIEARPGTVYVQLILEVAGCMLATSANTGSIEHTINIPYENMTTPDQTLDFDIPMPHGSLTLTAARLQYYTGTNGNTLQVTNTQWMPACVLNASYK